MHIQTITPAIETTTKRPDGDRTASAKYAAKQRRLARSAKHAYNGKSAR